MKTNLFLCLVAFMINSCMAQGKLDPKITPVAKIQGDEIVMIVDEETILNSVKSGDLTIKEVKNIRVDKENEFIYLLFEVEKESSVIPYAIRLNPVETGSKLLAANGTTHSCSGHCCESCVFTRNESGEITGCWCKRAATTPGCQTEARCDHSVSSSSGGILK